MDAVFKSFCSFGADKGAMPLMDGMKLVKLCRDLHLLDRNLTSTDVDIVFSKVKSKNERKINFKQFEEALKMIAVKKFPGTEDGFEKLKEKILEGGGPVAHGATKAVKPSAVDRVADSSKIAPKATSSADGGTKVKVKKGEGKACPSQQSEKSVSSSGAKAETARAKNSVGSKSAKESSRNTAESTVKPKPNTNEKEANNSATVPVENNSKSGQEPPGNEGM